jgi:hypothetical protein
MTTKISLIPNPTFDAPVKIHIPGELAEEITITFNHMTSTELKAFLASADARPPEEVLGDIVAGWSWPGVPFSADALKTLIENYHATGPVILQSYLDELLGRRRA